MWCVQRCFCMCMSCYFGIQASLQEKRLCSWFRAVSQCVTPGCTADPLKNCTALCRFGLTSLKIQHFPYIPACLPWHVLQQGHNAAFRPPTPEPWQVERSVWSLLSLCTGSLAKKIPSQAKILIGVWCPNLGLVLAMGHRGKYSFNAELSPFRKTITAYLACWQQRIF